MATAKQVTPANAVRTTTPQVTAGVKIGDQNTGMVMCGRCKSEVTRKAGATCTLIPNAWNDKYEWECGSCEATRKAAEQAEREKHSREAQVMIKLVPALDRLGTVNGLRTGPTEWEASARLIVNGHTYKVWLKEDDAKD